MCKKLPLNFLEAAIFIGMLLDLMHLSRKLEALRHDLMQHNLKFNLSDAFGHLLAKSGNGGRGYLTQLDMREALMSLGMRSDRVTMDRLYLFFRRYNVNADDKLTFSEFSEAVCVLHPHFAYVLRNRPEGIRGGFTEKDIFDFFTNEKFIAVLDTAIETEVAMETIRQKLAARAEFDAGQAFLTLLAYQRDGRDRDLPEAGAFHPGGIAKFVTVRDLEVLMKRHDHFDDLREGDLELLIQRFDRDNDGQISINEFFE